MAEKVTTLNQLKRMLLRAKVDSASSIAELGQLVFQGFENLQHDGILVDLPVSKWNDKVQIVNHSAFVADNDYWYFVLGDIDNPDDWTDAFITVDNIENDGEMIFRCTKTPKRDLNVCILRVGVEVIDE